MTALVQVKAVIPRSLKRRAFAALALRDEKFNHWVRRELEAFVRKSDAEELVNREDPQNCELTGTSMRDSDMGTTGQVLPRGKTP